MKRTPTDILSTARRLALSVALVCGGTACRAVPVAVTEQYQPPGGVAAVPITVLLQDEHRADGPRYVRGASAGLATMTEWTGAVPHGAIELIDPPRVSASQTVSAGAIVLDRTPWRSPETSMTPELAAARGIARRGWAEAIDTRALPAWFVDGLAEYTARRAVTSIFSQIDETPAYAMLEARWFGAALPRFIRIRLQPERDGDPLTAYRRQPGISPASSPPDQQRGLAAKSVMTLYTLDRWVGRPAFDAVLAAFVSGSRGRQPSLDDFLRVVSATTGQDLGWMLTPMLRGTETYDYAIADVQSRPLNGGFDTMVVVERRRDGIFAGSSAPRTGSFESGRGIALAVTFVGGETISDAWDGREARKTFRYHSATRAISATVDPDRVLVLDLHTTNNSWSAAPAAATASAHWSLRWMLWLEHALLTYGALA